MTFFQLKVPKNFFYIKLKGAKKMNKWKQKTERYYTGDKKKETQKKRKRENRIKTWHR